MAGLRGFLIQHATTLVYLPLAVLLRCLIVGELSRFWPSLYISLMINLSGVPIHTLLGFLTGVTLWYAAPKLNRHPQ
jgi:hypothetical protein